MKYTKLFKTHAEYESYINDNPFLPNVSYCDDNDDVHYNPWTWAEEYLTFVAKESGTFQLSTNAVSYSLDNGETWTELAANTASPTVTAGNKIMWKGTITPSSSGIGAFSATGNFDVQGNIMSLLYGDNYKGQTDLTGKDYTFCYLFGRNAKVVNAENLSLPATTLAAECYDGMFVNCTSLTTAPELPATTLTSYCYQYMFDGCTSLTTAPSVLPATTLTSGCYQHMFQNCTALTTAPVLSATTLADYCYDNMFRGCTSLTTAPELPVTTLTNGCYCYMFNGCTNLTTASELLAETLANNCYYGMFYGCSSLNYIKMLATNISASGCLDYWVDGVAATGTFVKHPSARLPTGVNGIPKGWTVQTASS